MYSLFTQFILLLVLNSIWLFKSGESNYVLPPVSPINVYYHMELNNLRKIDAVDSSFILDFYISIAWRDDRLYDTMMNDEDYDPITSFFPQPEFINVADEDSATPSLEFYFTDGYTLPKWVGVTASGDTNETWVIGSGRKIASFIADLQLEEFPFDKQNATVMLESLMFNSDDLRWVASDYSRKAIELYDKEVSGWDNDGTSLFITNYTYLSYDEQYSRVVFSKQLGRQYTYYLSRIVSNIIMIVIMGLAVAFAQTTESERMGSTQAAFLGVVSWLFVLNADVPKVGYLTRLDSFIQLSFAIIFIQFLGHAFHWGVPKFCKFRKNIITKINNPLTSLSTTEITIPSTIETMNSNEGDNKKVSMEGKVEKQEEPEELLLWDALKTLQLDTYIAIGLGFIYLVGTAVILQVGINNLNA